MAGDLHAGYWEEFSGGSNRKSTFIGRFKYFIDCLNAVLRRDALESGEFTRDTL